MILRNRLLPIVLLMLTAAWTASPAFARSGGFLKVGWKAVPRAKAYVVQVLGEGEKVLIEKKVSESRFSTDLEPGKYGFRIRTLDSIGREGPWSKVREVIVKPAPPTLSDDVPERLFVSGAKKSQPVEWRKIKGATGYRVRIKKDGAIVSEKEMPDPSAQIEISGPGNYRISVATTLGDLVGRFSQEREVRVERLKLSAPDLRGPSEHLLISEGEPIEFAWKAVEGAESYRLELRPVDAPTGPPVVREIVAPESMAAIPLPAPGRYDWKVQARAGEVTGPESSASFVAEQRIVVEKPASGFLAFSSMYAPYNYRVVSPATGFQGTTASTAFTFRLSGEYYFGSGWGVSAGMDNTFFSFVTGTFQRKSFELYFKRGIRLGGGDQGLFISPKLGVEAREYLHLMPSSSSQFMIVGPAAGIDLRKQFSERFSVGAKFSYFHPLSGAPAGGTLSADASRRNMSFGLQGLYWLNPRWAAALGGFIDNRSISYAPAGSTQSEQIYMDGTYFFGSLIWRFGG